MRSCFCKWYRGQVVRQESAKLSFPSSNLGGTSKKSKSYLGLGFFYPLRKQWHIINDSVAIVVSHQPVRAVYHHA